MTVKRVRGETQQKILDYIQQEIETRGYPPSVREIGDAVGLKSTSTVHGHLSRLQARGLIQRDAMKPRAMVVPNQKESAHARSDSKIVPLIGHVAAGHPILAEEFIEEQITLPDIMLGEGVHFILAVHGDSMIRAGIMDGDYVVVRKQTDASNGEIIVADIDGDATVKRFFREGDRIRLQPENPAMQPIYVRNVKISGKVVSVFRII